jgi:aspartate kinase
MRACLENGQVCVVAGFQGVDHNDNITTLGRGGSDTTAAALAAALKADECRIYTDVDGIYTADPRLVPDAQRLDRVTFEEMLELASSGARVLQTRSVEFAGRYKVPLRVLSSFEPGPGTLISYDEGDSMEQPLISGIAQDKNQAKLTLRGIPDNPGIAHKILHPIAEKNIDVDVIIQNVSTEGHANFTFTVNRADYDRCLKILEKTRKELKASDVIGDDNIAKVSVVGVGMRSHSGVANTMFATLAEAGINIQMIATSEIKISVIIDDAYMELAVRTLHKAFGLNGGV